MLSWSEPLGDLLASLVGRIEIMVAGADHEPRDLAQPAEIFPHHHALRSPVDQRAELEMVSGQHHDIKIGSALQHPIELWERIVQIGSRKQAHWVLSLRSLSPTERKSARARRAAPTICRYAP